MPFGYSTSYYPAVSALVRAASAYRAGNTLYRGIRKFRRTYPRLFSPKFNPYPRKRTYKRYKRPTYTYLRQNKRFSIRKQATPSETHTYNYNPKQFDPPSYHYSHSLAPTERINPKYLDLSTPFGDFKVKRFWDAYASN